MSASGTLQTSISTLSMSAFVGKVDMSDDCSNVCLAPQRTFMAPGNACCFLANTQSLGEDQLDGDDQPYQRDGEDRNAGVLEGIVRLNWLEPPGDDP